MARWMQTERVQRWGTTLALAFFVVVVGPEIVGAMESAPSVTDWVRLLAWSILVVGLAISTFGAWQRHRYPERSPLPLRPVSRPEILDEDLTSVMNRSGSKIEAIKNLRSLYPGLGLRDAKEVVEHYAATN